MLVSAEQNRSLNAIIEQLCSIEGVAREALDDGRIALEISFNGESRKLVIAGAADDYPGLKHQYRQIRETLDELGIREGMAFAAARNPRRPLSPEMLAAAAAKKKTFEAWQNMCREIREAEKALDIEYEYIQMQSYY